MMQNHIKTKINVSYEINHHEVSRYYKDNALRNQQSPLPLLWEKCHHSGAKVVYELLLKNITSKDILVYNIIIDVPPFRDVFPPFGDVIDVLGHVKVLR